MTTRRPALALASLLALSLAATACSSDSSPNGDASPTPTKEPMAITLGVWGDADELAGWKEVVDARNAANPTVRTTLLSWEGPDAARAHVETSEVPDVFMVSRDDLGLVLERNVSVPASELLDERGVDFGDRFSRDALQAMSAQGELQCMPWSINTQVVYVNEKLVDRAAMREEGLPLSSSAAKWGLTEFKAAAEFASRQGQRVAGVHVEPTIEALAPFILSGGGSIFDDETNPTSLAFSSDSTRDALEQTLEVLRDASLTPTDAALAKYSDLELFKAGRLGMFTGDRSLVPELRAVDGLEFGVQAMPRIDDARTTADVAGLCISAKSEYPQLAAGLIADIVTDENTATVIGSGPSTPANIAVAAEPEFLADEQFPSHSHIFTATLRGSWFPPLDVDWVALEASVAPLLQRLLSDPGEIDLDDLTEQIDAASKEFLAPETVTSPSPDASGSASPSPSETPETE